MSTPDAAELAYVEQVRREIDDEVRRRGAGDLPPQVERELDELFLRHAPHGRGGAGLADMLRQVDAAVFIDPMVPIASRRPAGAMVKRGLRSVNLWYQRWVTYQVSAFATAVSRALHVLDLQVSELRRAAEDSAPPPAVVVESPELARAGAWWAGPVGDELAGTAGRVLHAACGDGWLVQALAARGLDAYGVDPRPGAVRAHELDTLDLRQEEVGAHLAAVEPGALGAVVLSGVVDGAAHGERLRLVERAVRAVGADGTVVLHSLGRARFDAEDAPPEADLVPARPYRPATWGALLGDMGMAAEVRAAPSGGDYLVVARRTAPAS
ncbi:MAG TPA: hypothetical protein VMB72_14555 [Acidimicrobiales bacterium]|nr:hypothetical protein [Acidimicrobiales bacterium]